MNGLMEFGEEQVREQRLLEAQDKAVALFEAIEETGLLVPGIRESAASNAIRDLAADMFGIDRFWHKRIVRAGANTLLPYRENPPDRVVEADDIVFADFGPLFEGWEADLGRTFVLGEDPVKLRLRDSLPKIFKAGREFFHADPEITGERLYAHVRALAEADGWSFGNVHCGHQVGEFPHEKINGDEVESYIAVGSDGPMRRLDRVGRQCHWILEIHLVDPTGSFGGFYEELLDVGPGPA